FTLYDVLGAEALYAKLPGCESMTRELFDAVLDEGARFVEQVLVPLNATGDAEGCHHNRETGEVTTAKGFKAAYDQWVPGGWNGLTAAERCAVEHVPELIGLAVKEIIDAGNQSWSIFPLHSRGAVEALKDHGEPWQQHAFLNAIVEGR